MRPRNVALFKEFLDGKGMVTPFINMYRQNRIKTNPEKIEDYFRKCEEETVCTKAFYHFVNSRWGFDFWQKMQDAFNDFIESNPPTEDEQPWWYLHGRCKILRTNWDAKKHWKEESRAAAAKRLNITLPENLQDVIDIVSFKSDDEEQEIETTHNLLSEFNFVDLHTRRAVLKENEITINTRGGRKYTITFNQKCSNDIFSKGLKKAALMRNKANEVVLMMNNGQGVDVVNNKTNCCVNNKALLSRIIAFMDITEDYLILNIEEIANTKDYIAYKLIKC